MTRIGKIARLSTGVRQVLNVRLQENVPQEDIVSWLNELPEVKAVLDEHFEGRAITQQNLSDWKLGGHKDWLRQERVERVMESSQGLLESTKGADLADRMACVLTAELAGLADQLLNLSEDPRERWKQLKNLLRELVPLRRQNHRAVYARIAQSKQARQEVLWEREDEVFEDKEHEKHIKERQEEIMKPIMARRELERMLPLVGDDPDARAEAAFLIELKHVLPAGTVGWTQEQWEARSKEVESMTQEEVLVSKGMSAKEAKKRVAEGAWRNVGKGEVKEEGGSITRTTTRRREGV